MEILSFFYGSFIIVDYNIIVIIVYVLIFFMMSHPTHSIRMLFFSIEVFGNMYILTPYLVL